MDLVTVEFLSQACTALRAGDIEIVSDPWFFSTAHLNSWIPYPSWDARELESFRSRIDRATHIYVSHDHEDHFDPAFLETLGRKTILVGAFRNMAFRRQLEALGDRHDIRYLHHAREMSLSKEVSVQIFMEQPDFRLNSMMIVLTPHGTVLNANDCGLNRMILSSISRRFPVTLFTYTLNFLANGYPFPYLRRSDADLDSKIAAVRNDVLDNFRLALRILKPKLSAAFAGPVTFADRINDHLNSHPESRDWSRMVVELASEGAVIWPAPGSLLELRDNHFERAEIKEWGRFLGRPPAARPAVPTVHAPADLTLETALAEARGFIGRLSPVLERTGSRVHQSLILTAVPALDDLESEAAALWSLAIDLDPPAPSCRPLGQLEPPILPQLHIISTPEILHKFLSGDVTVDSLLLSSRARFHRRPDSFNPTLHNLLRFGGDPSSREALIEWLIRGPTCTETMTIKYGGQEKVIPKYCPHEGESFEAATIKDGRLVCPRHKWTFDLETGQCIAGDRSVNLYDLVPVEDA